MKTLLNIKTDKEVKEKAQKLAKEIGLPLSAIINAQLKQFIRDRKLQIFAEPHMSNKLESVIREAEQDIQKEKNISPLFSSARDVISYLHSQ
jgi:addiction module RelB/DinJ family antitoxin